MTSPIMTVIVWYAVMMLIIALVPKENFLRMGVSKMTYRIICTAVVFFAITLISSGNETCDLGGFGNAFMAEMKNGCLNTGTNGFSTKFFEWFIGGAVYVWSAKATLQYFGKTRSFASVFNVIGLTIVFANAFCIYHDANLEVLGIAFASGFKAILGA